MIVFDGHGKNVKFWMILNYNWGWIFGDGHGTSVIFWVITIDELG